MGKKNPNGPEGVCWGILKAEGKGSLRDWKRGLREERMWGKKNTKSRGLVKIANVSGPLSSP